MKLTNTQVQTKGIDFGMSIIVLLLGAGFNYLLILWGIC